MRTLVTSVMLCFATFTFAQEKAADFTLKNMKGEDVSLSDFTGKIVVIEWYASWCKKCRAAFPEVKSFFNRLKTEYENDVVPLAINLDKKKLEKVAAFVKKQGIEYMTLHDPQGISGKDYNLKMLPLIVVIDKDGTIAKKFQGHKKGKTEKEIEKTIKSLVA